ncbi:MAG: endopeptidase La [Clostridia bacterium]|nr:endopeptidase La [Clostridia bacterium]
MENTIEKELTKTDVIPVVPLRGKVAFPHVVTAFEVGRTVTLNALKFASERAGKLVFVCTQKDVQKESVEAEDLYRTGTVCQVRVFAQQSSGNYKVQVRGLFRAVAESIEYTGEYFHAVVKEIQTTPLDEVGESYLSIAKKTLKESGIRKEIVEKLSETTDADEFVDVLTASMGRLSVEDRQKMLEETDGVKRLSLLTAFLKKEIEFAKLERKIAEDVKASVDKSQKEYFLREQLKAIHAELGDSGKEEDAYRQKIKAKKLPAEVEEKCLKEVDRMSRMQQSSPEYTVACGYLDQVLELPWTEETQDTERLSDCVDILNEDHYGLEKIKERITEYLAVLKLTKSMNAPILCLVGPPGVGKTSIARSVARALGRKFVRMSLGGVKDEAEIRGHRKTYIGAMPGRILYAMKNAGSVNPVFLLDEIDKVSSDMRGDPASALLEVLDPEQNRAFRDRFLEVPYDLSKVLFITTANTLDTIPGPLRDRMEIINLSGYTPEEKSEIAMRYLVPKQLKENGISEKIAEFTPEGINAVIEGYTMEAGVRSLERTVGTLARKIAVKYADNKRMRKVKITKKKVEELLGPPRRSDEEKGREDEVGAVCGLAWTAFGGTTLTVEATATKGKGEIRLTGKLGDVMKESALAAITYIHSHAEKFGVKEEAFENTDIHVHVPEGATPKDGPSAGITIATAILSVLTGKKVRADVAMTGEITLRGKVLPIGGLKEKSLAASRAGIKTVIIPKANTRDLKDVPDTVKKQLTFYPVESAEEVFKKVFA